MAMFFFLLACCSFVLMFLSFVVYPASLAFLSYFIKPPKTLSSSLDPFPVVSLIVACYNEEEHIAQKIENSLQLDYPSGNLEILVFSDGSTDRTDEIIGRYKDRGVQLVRVPGRLGKTHCQNELSKIARGEVLVFSDANTMYSPDSISEIVAAFNSSNVGGVIGHRIYSKNGKHDSQEGLYERFESWIKERESALGGTIGANGSIYAIRAENYVHLPADRMSDITEPLRVAMDHGQKIVFAVKANGYEDHDNDFWLDLKRKRRIVLRAMNSLWSERRLLVRHPLILIKLIFHKIIRWLTLPLLIVGAVAALITESLILNLLGLSAAAYLLLSLSVLILYWQCGEVVLLKTGRVGKLLLYSFGVFLSAFVATWDFIRGRNIRVWESRA